LPVNLGERMRKAMGASPGGMSAAAGGGQRRGNRKMDLLARLTKEPLPFAALLGIELVSAAPERLVAEMLVRDELCTRPPVLHGGAIMAFADTLGALATLANLPEEGRTATIESKTNFLSTAPAGTRVTGEVTPLHRGRRTMVWQTRVTGEDGRLVAVVTQTQLVFAPGT
jgi:1,4-dihydroxy-2-naphthoyl-CoA hydrolase